MNSQVACNGPRFVLDFDLRKSFFVYCDVELVRGSTLNDISKRLDGRIELTHDRPDWASLRVYGPNVNASLFFQEERLRSGYFGIDVSGSTNWHEFERDEALRREKHGEIMKRLFGAEAFANGQLTVELRRDPRTPLEVISFSFC